jgi:YD repeat-containing protein
VNSHVSGVSRGGYDARRRIEEIRRKKSSAAGDNDGFLAFSARLRNLLLPEKLKPLGITKYDAKQDPVQWLRCYALSIENAGGDNDTKCLYFPFCLDQAPLTWLESLEKYSIDKRDQLKEQFTSNFAGAMGRSSTRMDLAMVKQEQGETLRKYMRLFFDKSATVVDVTDKEFIDLFQDGLYHRRTFEYFGRRRLSSITHLKDMITSWADEEDKVNAKYDAIRGKSK